MTPVRRSIAAAMTATALAGAVLAGAPAASAAGAAPPAAAARSSEQDQALVAAWYGDFLGREPDASASYWVGRVAVQNPADVLWAITHTDEFNTNEITAYYQDYLGRDPDAGARYWIDGANSGAFPLEWVEQNILASPEFARRHGPDVVDQWFRALLGRPVLDQQVNFWNNQIRSKGSLGALRTIYYERAVYVRVENTFVALLGRRTNGGSELDYWGPKEVESDINVAVLIASTPEYRSLLEP